MTGTGFSKPLRNRVVVPVYVPSDAVSCTHWTLPVTHSAKAAPVPSVDPSCPVTISPPR